LPVRGATATASELSFVACPQFKG